MVENYPRNQTPVTHHPAALKTACLAEVNLCEGARFSVCCCVCMCTLAAQKHHLHFTRTSNPPGLLLHQCRDISKARMSVGSIPVLLTPLQGFATEAGGSIPWDEGISWNQEAVGLAEGYFLGKRFLNCRGDQRRWLSVPEAVYSDKHPAKCGLDQGGHGWTNVVCLCGVCSGTLV